MKKQIRLIIVFCVFAVAGIAFLHGNRKAVRLCADEKGLYVSLKTDNENIILRPWQKEENAPCYFFLPAFADGSGILIDDSMAGANIDGVFAAEGSRLRWQQGGGEHRIERGKDSWNVKFMKSENLPAFFISTESKSMEFIHENKDNRETGDLTVVNADGNTSYAGMLDKISARGNTTFNTYKKPYNITLHDKKALCGLEAGRKWTLLALYFEHDKIHSKIIYDMAREMGMKYTPECTWVDLYCNGTYMGLYLLTEAPDVGEGRIEIYDLEKEIKNLNPELLAADGAVEKTGGGYALLEPDNSSGGYLIELTPEERLQKEKDVYFETPAGYYFVLKSPKYATEGQRTYIQKFVCNIENLIVQEDPSYKNYIDLQSFARQFLIDKMVLDIDAMRYSTFYYKEKDSDILYSGPIWDYDRALGGYISDYEAAVEAKPNNMNPWYMSLYQDEEFYGELVENYRKVLPYAQKMLTQGIDEYADMIRPSVEMDTVLMHAYAEPNETISYTCFDSYIRYLKFFMANRLNYLNSLWGVTDIYFDIPEFTGECHEVVFEDETGAMIERRMVMDGECLEEFPAVSGEEGGYWMMNGGKKGYETQIPILEDMLLTYHR